MAQYKLVVMCSCQVGKSALIFQLFDDCPVSDHDPTLGDIYRTYLVVDGELCQLHILDTGSSEDQPSEWWPFMLGGEGFLCVYAVDDIMSFMDADILWEEVWRVKGSNNIPFILVANTTERQVTWGLGKMAAKEFRVPYVETSAQDRQSVEWAFLELVQEIQRVHQSLSTAGHDWGWGSKPCMIL